MKMHLTHRFSTVWLMLVGLAFALGLAVAAPGGAIQAGESRSGGYTNMVYEVTQAGAGLNVRQIASQQGTVLDTLLWGDRVLWAGDSTYAEGYRWLKVAISDGRTGWIVDVSNWLVESDPVYTTPGMGMGARVTVTQSGDDSHCRALPSASSTEFRIMQVGDQMTVIGGPYQAEYWIWWRYRLSSGYECWIVDVPGWFNVLAPGVF
ncbi:MAG: SH3 domain-containing protein [Anaerolineae bacterium]|nr:SH3 domain-containing protein [Anaerolineae bacterium]